MEDEILDDWFIAQHKIRSKEDIKEGLRKAGIHTFYEHKNGTIIVKQKDAVRVAIHYENRQVIVKPKFPQIGNSIQILFSAILLGVFLFVVPIPFPLQWVFAILGGQVISYMIHMPKTRTLKERIERFIQH